MLRRALLFTAAAIGCVAIAITSFLLFRIPDRSSPLYHAPEEALPEAIAEPEPHTPPVARANTILSLPAGDNAAAAAALAPTLITLDLERVPAEHVLMALSEASKVPITLPSLRPPNNGELPLFSLHLQDQPLMEALLQLEAQGLLFTAASATADQPFNVQYARTDALPGVWSITGPFTFVVTAINHTVTLDRQGRPAPNAMDGGDTVTLQINARFEPKLHVLRFPMQLEVLEAVDERGHSLMPARVNPPNVTNTNFALRATLAYPPQDAGRIIKTLRGTATYTVQLDSTPVKIDDPMTTLPTEKTINGVTAHIKRGVWNEAARVLEMTVTYKRATFSGDWNLGAQALAGIRPRIEVGDDRLSYLNSNASVAGDTVTASYGFMLPPRTANRGNLPVGLPVIRSITFDFPTGAAQVVVPVEFHDLPLP